MKFNLATTALCLLSSVSVSFAAPATDFEIRAPSDASQIQNAPTEDIWCLSAEGGWVQISPQTVTDSIIAAAKLRDQSQQQDGYPSRIKNPQSLGQGLPSGFSGVLMHYPIAETSSGTAVYDGRNFADNLRVMYQYKKDSQEATFTGVWTHANAASGQYVWCGTMAQWGY